MRTLVVLNAANLLLIAGLAWWLDAGLRDDTKPGRTVVPLPRPERLDLEAAVREARERHLEALCDAARLEGQVLRLRRELDELRRAGCGAPAPADPADLIPAPKVPFPER